MRRLGRRSAVHRARGTHARQISEDLISRLRRDADRIATHFGLEYRELVPERANVKRRYGICYDDGSIAVRLRHVRSGEPLKYSSLINTLCHELAHLRYFNHGPRFKDFYFRILEYARWEGIYRPGKAGEARGEQLSLFSVEANGLT